MKKVRIILSVAAIVFAFGATFATQFHARPSSIAYEFIPATEEDPAQCVELTTECQPSGQSPCALVNGHQVRAKADVQTQCGDQLMRP